MDRTLHENHKNWYPTKIKPFTVLHYIFKCIHLEWRWLFGPFRYVLIQTVRFIVYIISIPDEKLFSVTAVGCITSYFVKIIWCSRWLSTPPPILRLYIALFAVAEGWLLLDIGGFVLFLKKLKNHICTAHFTTFGSRYAWCWLNRIFCLEINILDLNIISFSDASSIS